MYGNLIISVVTFLWFRSQISKTEHFNLIPILYQFTVTNYLLQSKTIYIENG